MLERRFALAGEACSTDLEVYQRCANSLRRLLEAVGLQRRQRVVSSLGELLQQDIEQQRRDARERPLQQAEVEVVSP